MAMTPQEQAAWKARMHKASDMAVAGETGLSYDQVAAYNQGGSSDPSVAARMKDWNSQSANSWGLPQAIFGAVGNVGKELVKGASGGYGTIPQIAMIFATYYGLDAVMATQAAEQYATAGTTGNPALDSVAAQHAAGAGGAGTTGAAGMDSAVPAINQITAADTITGATAGAGGTGGAGYMTPAGTGAGAAGSWWSSPMAPMAVAAGLNGVLGYVNSQNQAQAAQQATAAQVAQQNKAMQMQVDMYNQNQALTAPWYNTGKQGINALGYMMGLNSTAPQALPANVINRSSLPPITVPR